MESPGIRVLVAHPNGLARAALRALLEREPDVVVVGDAARSEDAIALAEELAPDVVVIHGRLPRVGAQRLAPAGVVLLGGCDEDDELFGALRAGARGLLAEDAEPAELLHAVRSLSRGHAVLSPSVARRLVDELAAQPDRHRPVPARLEELTAREREVMGLVALGLSNGEIAARLVVSPATAKTHVSRAMLKLGARDRAQLVTLAYQARLVEARPTIGLAA
jgi:DNA-binding NarL/FixJ family response regulator